MSPSPGRRGAAGRPAPSHASTVLLRSARCGESGQPPSKTVAYTVLRRCWSGTRMGAEYVSGSVRLRLCAIAPADRVKHLGVPGPHNPSILAWDKAAAAGDLRPYCFLYAATPGEP